MAGTAQFVVVARRNRALQAIAFALLARAAETSFESLCARERARLAPVGGFRGRLRRSCTIDRPHAPYWCNALAQVCCAIAPGFRCCTSSGLGVVSPPSGCGRG